MSTATRTARERHHICETLRQLRLSTGWSLVQFQEKFGIAAVAVSSYERGDRLPPLPRVDQILACYGYRLEAVPVRADSVLPVTNMVERLRAIADQLEARHALSALSRPTP